MIDAEFWLTNPALRSFPAIVRAFAADVMALMSQHKPPGYLTHDGPITAHEIARRLRAPDGRSLWPVAEALRSLRALEKADVFQRDDDGVLWCRAIAHAAVASPPTNKPARRAKAIDDDDMIELRAWCVWWNACHGNGLVSRRVNADNPARATTGAFQRAKRDDELRALLFDDPDAMGKIADALRHSSLARGAKWFHITDMFNGRNQSGEFKVAKLLDGGYADAQPTGQTLDGMGSFINGE